MANKNNAKVQFTAETKEFNEAISKSNEEMSNFRAELKLNATQMKANGVSIDGLEKKHELLEGQLEVSQNKIEAINEKIKSSLKYYDENSSEVLKLKTQLANAKTEEEKLQKAIADCNEELNEQKTSSKDAGEGFTVMKGVIADLTSNAIQGAIDKISEFAGYIMSLPAETMELRQDMATLTTAFDDMGFSTAEANDTWKELYKVFGEDDRAVETANNISKISDNQKDLNSWVDITTGVWGTYQDSLPVEGLAEAAMETAKTGAVTGALADALNWGAKEGEMFGLKLQKNIKFTELSSEQLKKLTDKEKEEYKARKKQYEETEEYNNTLQNSTVAEEKFQLALNKCSSEQERQELITSTLTRLYGSAADTYRDTSAAQMEAKEATAENILAENELATAIEPVTTEFNKLKNDALTQIIPVVQEVSGAMLGALDWMQAHPTAMKVIAAVVGILTAALTALTVVTIAQTVAQWALNAAVLANPITWIVVGIVAAITALVAIFAVLWNECDGFREFFIGIWEAIKLKWDEVSPYFEALWEGIKTAFSIAADFICMYFAMAWEYIKLHWSVVIEWFGLIWETLKNAVSVATTYISGAFKTAWAVIKLTWAVCGGYFKAVWNSIKGIFSVVKAVLSGDFKGAWEAIKGIVGGWVGYFANIWSKIKGVFSSVKSWYFNTFSSAWNAVKNVFSSVGSFFSGVVSKIKSTFSKIPGILTKPFSTGLDKIKSFFSKLKLKFPNIKLPHFSIKGKFSLEKMTVPKLSIDWYKNGGIMTKPTIFGFNGFNFMAGGEAGPEAILPIDKLEGYIVNAIAKTSNTIDIQTLADKIERLADRPIELNINGKQFAQATASDTDSVNGLRSTFKSRGLILD